MLLNYNEIKLEINFGKSWKIPKFADAMEAGLGVFFFSIEWTVDKKDL